MTNPLSNPRVRKALKIALIVLLAIAVAAGTVAGVFAWLYYQGRQSLQGSGNLSAPSEAVQDDDLLMYKGKKYRYNEQVSAVMVIGVDKKSIQDAGQYGENGQADVLFLMAVDADSGAVHILPISREAMVDVDQYALDGSYSGVEKLQLCLAYAYAASGEEGCQNVMRSVSRLLYGIPLEKYVAIDMNGLSALTDAVDGVTVTSLEDMVLKGTAVKAGQAITLNGTQAVDYIRLRDQDTEANNRRMQRQRQFFLSFMSKTGQILQKNAARLTGLYNTAKPYTVTNVTLSELTYLAGSALPKGGWSNPRIHTIVGDTVMGEEFVEFYADSASAYEAVLAIFYTEVN